SRPSAWDQFAAIQQKTLPDTCPGRVVESRLGFPKRKLTFQGGGFFGAFFGGEQISCEHGYQISIIRRLSQGILAALPNLIYVHADNGVPIGCQLIYHPTR